MFYSLRVHYGSRGVKGSRSLNGTKLIAGGNAPGKLVKLPDPERVAPCQAKNNLTDVVRRDCDPFRVGLNTSLPGALPPAINFMPLRHVHIWVSHKPFSASSIARNNPRAFSTVSAYSCSGTESATMPAPA